MGFLEDNGRAARVFYTNILYLTMGVLATLIAANLNAEYKDGVRFEQCALVGSTDANSACAAEGALTEDQLNQNQQLFNISLATAIVNGLLFVVSVANHWGYAIALHFRLQGVLSLVNVGLFAGLVGWFNAAEAGDAAATELNLENNIYYQDYNPFAIAVVGLVAGVLDTVIFNSLNMFYFNGRCNAE